MFRSRDEDAHAAIARNDVPPADDALTRSIEKDDADGVRLTSADGTKMVLANDDLLPRNSHCGGGAVNLETGQLRPGSSELKSSRRSLQNDHRCIAVSGSGSGIEGDT